MKLDSQGRGKCGDCGKRRRLNTYAIPPMCDQCVRQTTERDTLETIRPILWDTYGETSTADALAADLTLRIDAEEWDSRGREHMVMITCWHWFSGGSTAKSVAKRIEEALR